jgi:hypothetical protein
VAGFVFKTALADRGGGMPEEADYTPAPEELQIQEELRRRIAQGIKPRFSPEEMDARVARNEREYQLGLVAMLSGNKNMQGAGGLVLKKALADREPVVTERGTTDPLRGTFQYNPDYLQERYQQQLDQSQTRVGAGRERWEMGRQGAKERALRDQQHKEMMLALQAGKPERGNYQPSGVAPDGSQVVLNSNNGMSYKVTLGPDGQPVYTPYLGASTPKAVVEKGVEAIGPAAVSAAGANATQKQVEANPGAFGVGATIVSKTPGLAKGWVSQLMNVSPQDLKTRANILKKAAMESNALYGAAQSMGELEKAKEFLTGNDDADDLVLSKNAAARDWFKNAAKAQGPTVAAILVARNPELAEVFADDPAFMAKLRAATPNASGQVNAAPPAAAASDPYGWLANNPSYQPQR